MKTRRGRWTCLQAHGLLVSLEWRANGASTQSQTRESTMAQIIWRGAISFGLVHIPVRLYPAISHQRVGFDLLDKRSMDPIGYRKINKRTGKEVDKGNIVRGFEYEK